MIYVDITTLENNICHHSSYHKVDRENNKRDRSKNTYYSATIKIVIKVNIVSTRKADLFVKVRTIFFYINQPINL